MTLRVVVSAFGYTELEEEKEENQSALSRKTLDADYTGIVTWIRTTVVTLRPLQAYSFQAKYVLGSRDLEFNPRIQNLGFEIKFESPHRLIHERLTK